MDEDEIDAWCSYCGEPIYIGDPAAVQTRTLGIRHGACVPSELFPSIKA